VFHKRRSGCRDISDFLKSSQSVSQMQLLSRKQLSLLPMGFSAVIK